MTRRAAWGVAVSAGLVLPGAALLGSCAAPPGPPPIQADAPCATCAMEASSPRFASERQVGGSWRIYDAIECLMRDAATASPTTIWLPDYDERRLHRADSLWIVQGDLATPMGGGLVAFRSRATADSIAVALSLTPNNSPRRRGSIVRRRGRTASS